MELHLDQITPYHLLLTVVVGLVAAWLAKLLLTRPKNFPPGPRGLPLLGVAPKFIGISDPLVVLSEFADKYGDIISFYFGPKLVVLLNSYDVIVEAFRHPDLQNRPRSILIEEASGFGHNGLLLGDGEAWKEQRKFVHSVFRSLGVGKKTYEDMVSLEMTQLGDAIEERKGSPFDPTVIFEQAVANVICSIIFGTQYKYTDTDFQHILHLVNTNTRIMGGGGWLFFIPVPGLSKVPFGVFKTLTTNAKQFYAFLDAQIEAHKQNFDPNDTPRDFIDQYLIKWKEAEGSDSSFNQFNLKADIADLFFAGTETTTTTLKWCILYMMMYPDVQSRVQAEIDQVVGRNRLPGLDDRKDLPYTNAVLMEVQRKAAVAAMGVPHSAAVDVTLRGYTIPKDTIIFSNLWRVLNTENIWQDNDAFKPERYINEDGKLIKKDELIFFSTGRRVCLGERLARMETYLGFTSLLQRFTFKKPDNSPPLSDKGVLGATRNTGPYLTCAIPR